jgi:hypothetical protein
VSPLVSRKNAAPNGGGVRSGGTTPGACPCRGDLSGRHNVDSMVIDSGHHLLKIKKNPDIGQSVERNFCTEKGMYALK